MSARRPTKATTIAALRDLAGPGAGDGEERHAKADAAILAYLPDDVREAYEAVAESANFWAFA